MRQGVLIALEGIDGSGTTTQARLLAEHLERRGLRTHTTAEPSSGPLGRFIRGVLRGEENVGGVSLALMFAADRVEHVANEIEPQLSEGVVVISDRYLLSSLAYQSLAAPMDWVADLNRFARRPDLSLLLRVSAETAARRRDGRGGPRELFDADATQVRIARAYEDALARADVGPCEALDAEGAMETVTAQIARRVEALLAERGFGP